MSLWSLPGTSLLVVFGWCHALDGVRAGSFETEDWCLSSLRTGQWYETEDYSLGSPKTDGWSNLWEADIS